MASWTLAGSTGEGNLRIVRGDGLRPTTTQDVSEADCSNLEMNGLNSCVLASFSSAGICPVRSRVLFPTLYGDPRDFRGYLSAPLSLPSFLRDQCSGKPTEISYDGISLKLVYPSLSISVFVSPDIPTVWIIFEKENASAASFPTTSSKAIIKEANGNTLYCYSNFLSHSRYTIAYSCCPEDPGSSFDDYQARKTLVGSWTNRVSFIHPDINLTGAMYFAKIRTQEAIFAAKRLGKVHSPGGGMFYGGVWCNDQAEYAAPIFPLLHDPVALLNSLRVLALHFDREQLVVPYSIEIDGGYVGRLDRGDAAMYAWGASLMLLALNRPEVTAEFWNHIQFCVNIILEKVFDNINHVVPSQSDELEGRYASGEANLSVNCLAVLALDAAAEVAMLFPEKEENCANMYREVAAKLRSDIHYHFSVDGPEKYAYFKGCDDPRGWICLTGLAGLPNGTDALRYALENLWMPNSGVLTSSLSSDVWDRCTLYAIQAAFQQDSLADLAAKKLTEFVRNRLNSGTAAPYAVENTTSWAQLSAESALLLRTVTEGLLGMRFRGDGSLHMTPKCPGDWNQYQVLKIPFGSLLLDVSIEKTGEEQVSFTVNFDGSEKEITLKCGDGVTLEKRSGKLIVGTKQATYLLGSIKE